MIPTIILISLCSSTLANKLNVDNDIIISYEDRIEIINGTDTSIIESFSLSPTINYIVGVTTDGLDRFMFLSDFKDSGTTIFKVSLDKDHSISPIVKKNSLEMVESVAFNRLQNDLYYSDSIKKRILRSKIDDTVSEPEDIIVFTKEDNLHGVAVDSCKDKLYWVNWNKKDPKIETSNLNGSMKSTLIKSNLSKPYSLIIDEWERSLYWIDMNKNGVFKIERILLDDEEGKSREIVCWGSGNSPFAMTVSRHHVYWSDWQNSVIWRIEKHGSNCIPTPVKRLSSSRPMGISTLSVPNTCIAIDKHNASKTSDKKFMVIASTPTTTIPSVDSVEIEHCSNYCLHGLCSLNSINIPICKCQIGFAGSRCQNDLCHNFCLNEGICVIGNSTFPECHCKDKYSGKRCQFKLVSNNFIDISQNDLYLYMFISMVILSIILIILLMAQTYFYRRRNNMVKKQKSIDSPPQIIKSKRHRVISGSKNGDLLNKSSSLTCSVELEDCCQMTLCDTPCVEVASYRKAKRRGVSVSEDDTSVLLDNDHLRRNRCSSVGKSEDLF